MYLTNESTNEQYPSSSKSDDDLISSYSESQSSDLKNKRKSSTRALYWIHFTRKDIGATCNICSEVFGDISLNIYLKRHLQDKHKDEYDQIYDNSPKKRIVINSKQKEEIGRRTVIMMAIENRPFALIHGKYFQFMMGSINENWSPIDYKTMHKYLKILYNEMMSNMKKELENQKSLLNFFCQTSDGWKNEHTNDHYVKINLWYIDEHFEHKKLNLATIPFEGEHETGEAISELYKSMYKKLNIEDSEIVEVIDGGSNFQKAAQILGHKSLHCNCHAIQLSLNLGLKWEEYLVFKCERIVSLFNQSKPAAVKLELAQKHLNQEKKTLFQKNDTRWNSTFNMIKRIVEQREALVVAFKLIKEDKQIKSNVENLTEDENKEASLLVEFLEFFTLSTKYFEEDNKKDNFPISGMIPAIHTLCNHCLSFVDKHEKEISENFKTMIEVIEKDLFGRYLNVDLIFLATSLFNPSFKLNQNFFHKDNIDEVINMINEEMKENTPPLLRRISSIKNKFLENLFAECKSSEEDELTLYLNENRIKVNRISNYWKETRFKKLQKLSRKYLCIRASQSDVESDFSFLKDMNPPKRNRLGKSTLSMMTSLRDNIHLLPQYYQK
jgi:hypothetical protein